MHSRRKRLSNHLQSGTRLDHVASAFAFNDDASFRRVGRASTSVNQKARASTHVVGGRRVQIVAVRHALEGVHISQGVRSLRERTDADLALAGRIVAARSRLATAASISVNVRAIEGGSIKVMVAHGVSVRSAGSYVQFCCVGETRVDL